MLTKDDFKKKIGELIDQYPQLANAYMASDPRLLQHLHALATMLSMVSAQTEVGINEVFDKSRGSTILADAAMRGLIKKGKPCRVKIRIENKNATTSYNLDSSRVVIDSSGNYYLIAHSVSIAPLSVGYAVAVQVTFEELLHTVNKFEPFYSINVPDSSDGSYLAGISVFDEFNYEYTHAYRYVNILPGDKVYHIETDDRQRTYIRFGFDGYVGYQPPQGAVYKIRIARTKGDIRPKYDSPFSFEYAKNEFESNIEMKMEALEEPGESPMSLETLKDMSRYPSIYDKNAVFLGEFDYLVRQNFHSLKFLSVWNEVAEEHVRGPSVDNINRLFVACVPSDYDESLGDSHFVIDDLSESVAIGDGDLKEIQLSIRDCILNADDSYRVSFRKAVKLPVYVTIKGFVANSYVAADIKTKIEELILANFGLNSPLSKRGNNTPLYQQIYRILKDDIPAFQAQGADIVVNVDDKKGLSGESNIKRPEFWRYVATETLSVNVETKNILIPTFGVGSI